MQGLRWLAGTILLLLVQPLAASSEDELWIERYMSEPGHSAQPVAMRRGYRVAWKDLSHFVGVPVKITTDTGSTHRGRIERADGRELRLRAESFGGYADLTLRQDQVINTELE